MKGLRNKVILSGIVLMFAFIATIGSTYAWFTVSTETSVEALDMKVTTADNILIRAKHTRGSVETSFESDPLNLTYWTTGLDQDMLADAGYLYETISGSIDTLDLAYSDPWRLKPATVIQDGYTAYNAKTLSYLDSLTDVDRSLTEITELEVPALYNDYTGYYIKLELYLLSQAEEARVIEIDPLVTSIYAENDDSNLDIVANATRISIWLDDNVLSNPTPQTEGSAFIFGNDTDYGYTFTGEGEVNSGSSLGTGGVFNSLSDLISTEAFLTDSVIDIDATYTTGQDIEHTADLFTIQPFTPTLVSVLIYIEGWDAQTTNAIVNALFNISFGFKFGEVGIEVAA
jgi:hypothetical protein